MIGRRACSTGSPRSGVSRQCDAVSADPPRRLAAIIKAANAYDDLVGGSAEYGPRRAALERLRLGTAYDARARRDAGPDRAQDPRPAVTRR